MKTQQTLALTALSLGAAAILCVMFYAVEPGNFFTYTPWHHDDFRELFKTGDYSIDFQATRPVTEYAFRLLGNAGPLWFYLALHALLAVDLALFFLLALDIFGHDRLALADKAWVFLLGTIVSASSPDLAAIVKYTGNIDHLTSLLFGIPSVLLLRCSRRLESSRLIAWSVFLFTLSILAKEDTVLFLGVAALFSGIPALRSSQRLSYKVSLIAAGLLSLGIIGFLLHPASGNAWHMLKLTLTAENRAYGLHTSLDELTAVLRYLVWPSAYYLRVHLMFLAACILHVVITRRTAALAAAVLFAALIAPYSVLGTDHVFGHYRFNFSPFAACCALIMAAELVRLLQERNKLADGWAKATRWVWVAACIGVAAILFRAAKPERHDILAWHNNLQMVSRKVLDGITELTPELKAAQEIHVIGADGPINPFFWQDGVVYINDEILRAPVKWIIHYRTGSELQKTLETFSGSAKEPVISYMATDGNDTERWRPRIEVDESFNTRFIPAAK